MLVICPRHLAKLPRHLPQALSGFFPQCLLVLQSVAPVAAEFIRRLTRKLLQLLAKSGNLSRAFPPKSLLLGCKRFYLPELGIPVPAFPSRCVTKKESTLRRSRSDPPPLKTIPIWSSLALIQILIYYSRKRSALECTAAQSFNGKRNRIF